MKRMNFFRDFLTSKTVFSSFFSSLGSADRSTRSVTACFSSLSSFNMVAVAAAPRAAAAATSHARFRSWSPRRRTRFIQYPHCGDTSTTLGLFQESTADYGTTPCELIPESHLNSHTRGFSSMPNNENSTLPEGLGIKKVLEELEVPFPPEQVQWRVMNTSNDKRRGQIVPYADPRAYTDRLNALFSPQGWTRDYRIETMNNITRVKKGETIVTGKVLVTCTVTIIGLWSHSGTGEEWADDDNGMTSADAQAFKRACSCFGLGRYFYDFNPPWVDLDQNRRPRRTPPLPAWAIPENWRKGMRPPGTNGIGKPASNNLRANGGNGVDHAAVSQPRPSNGTNGHDCTNGTSFPVAAVGHASDENINGGNGTASNALDARILRMEASVGTAFYRNILREHGRVNQPKLIRDVAVKQKVLRVLESAARGINRLDAVTQILDSTTVSVFLAKLQAPPLKQIADMKTLEQVVF